jgi:hypothetical protein
VDKAGNPSSWSGKYYIRVDKSAPNTPTSTIRYDSSSGTVRSNTTSWTNRTLWWGSFSAADNGSAGIDHYEYSTGCTGTKSGNLSTSHTYSTNTNYTFCIRSVDKAGNPSSWSGKYYIRVDKTNPSSSSVSVGSFVMNQNSLTYIITASGGDALSGVQGYQFSTNNGSNWSGIQSSNKYTVTVTSNFTHNVKVRTVDNAGNYLDSGSINITPKKALTYQLYERVLGREPATSEVDYHAAKTYCSYIARDISWSQDAKNRFGSNYNNYVGALYWGILGREADSSGLSHWVTVTQKEGINSTVKRITNNAEFQNTCSRFSMSFTSV